MLQASNQHAWIRKKFFCQNLYDKTWIFGVLAWLALAFAAVGLYSVVSYSVAQRTNEFDSHGAGRISVLHPVEAAHSLLPGTPGDDWKPATLETRGWAEVIPLPSFTVMA
jgi:hypothetical protein